MLKIKQSYHGKGSNNGYKWRVYDDIGRKLGELPHFPIVSIGDTVVINGETYEVTSCYDSEKSYHQKSEVHFIELKEFKFIPQYDLGEII